jgi:hypothetical protein
MQSKNMVATWHVYLAFGLVAIINEQLELHSQGLYLQLCNIACCKRSVINMGIKIHNNLPSEWKRIENFKVFKNKLKSYLLQNCFYSLQEFFSNNDRQ